jgi:hypothetical protein
MSKQMTHFCNGKGSWVESGGRGQCLGKREARGESRKRKRGCPKCTGSRKRKSVENWETEAGLGSGDRQRDAGNRGKGRCVSHSDVPVLGTDSS